MLSVHPYTILTEEDILLFQRGRHCRLYQKMGSHHVFREDESGVYFCVWAPHAKMVSVIGDFNQWNKRSHILYPRIDGSGIWEGFIPNLRWGDLYKYAIESRLGQFLEKSDPFAVSWEQGIQAASQISTTWYEWSDDEWMKDRWKKNSLSSPIAVYELHLGSWARDKNKPGEFLSYREIANRLVPYLVEMGFTHVEFMPVMEYPYDPSWGYQITGFFAATSRFGAPQDLMYLINELHRHDIGVILDWVPSHFPGDGNGLFKFDGTSVYEYEDPRKGYHPDWQSHIFDYNKGEVRSFLLSSAFFWLDRYHVDGLRVDAVSSMLYLDYSRPEGAWIPNEYGGNINLEAQSFLQDFNTNIHKEYRDVLTIAEESTDFPKVTHSVSDGGLGFDLKWMMGWMHDTLDYFKLDFIFRKHHQEKLTFSSVYTFHEKYMLPLSHDEVVHGKSSLIYKMFGSVEEKFANLRALFVYKYMHPGAKLLFMGSEFAQTAEWNFQQSLDWHLLKYNNHRGIQRLTKDLNKLYLQELCLYRNQFSRETFEWVSGEDAENSVFIFIRKLNDEEGHLMTILNLRPQQLEYKIGIPKNTEYEIVMYTDDTRYGGKGSRPEIQNYQQQRYMGRASSMEMLLPPLCAIILKSKKIVKRKSNKKKIK